ncbi:unnamed protein product [Protopolystoma xenopodis]|uniref:Uncharacterized protein n=1 Tax=Protopolystoma xenopodis TaxID=117903 RepID=A0A3S5CQ88_9PLAT|nr:unnamed protein product [Protopolystoma xenopodis]
MGCDRGAVPTAISRVQRNRSGPLESILTTQPIPSRTQRTLRHNRLPSSSNDRDSGSSDSQLNHPNSTKRRRRLLIENEDSDEFASPSRSQEDLQCKRRRQCIILSDHSDIDSHPLHDSPTMGTTSIEAVATRNASVSQHATTSQAVTEQKRTSNETEDGQDGSDTGQESDEEQDGKSETEEEETSESTTDDTESSGESDSSFRSIESSPECSQKLKHSLRRSKRLLVSPPDPPSIPNWTDMAKDVSSDRVIYELVDDLHTLASDPARLAAAKEAQALLRRLRKPKRQKISRFRSKRRKTLGKRSRRRNKIKRKKRTAKKSMTIVQKKLIKKMKISSPENNIKNIESSSSYLGPSTSYPICKSSERSIHSSFPKLSILGRELNCG